MIFVRKHPKMKLPLLSMSRWFEKSSYGDCRPKLLQKKEHDCFASLKCSKNQVTAALACHQISANTSVTRHRQCSQVKHFKMIGVSAKNKDCSVLDSSVLRFQCPQNCKIKRDDRSCSHSHLRRFVCQFKLSPLMLHSIATHPFASSMSQYRAFMSIFIGITIQKIAIHS